MLGKMLIHGFVAAAIVGSTAAVYAQAKDNGYLSPQAAAPKAAEAKAADRAMAAGDDGYIRPNDRTLTGRQDGEGKHALKSERHRDRHDRKRDHDHDDD